LYKGFVESYVTDSIQKIKPYVIISGKHISIDINNIYIDEDIILFPTTESFSAYSFAACQSDGWINAIDVEKHEYNLYTLPPMNYIRKHRYWKLSIDGFNNDIIFGKQLNFPIYDIVRCDGDMCEYSDIGQSAYKKNKKYNWNYIFDQDINFVGTKIVPFSTSVDRHDRQIYHRRKFMLQKDVDFNSNIIQALHYNRSQEAFIDYNDGNYVLPDIDFTGIDPLNYDEINRIYKKCISILKEPDFKENEEKIKLDMLTNLLEYALYLLVSGRDKNTLIYFIKMMGGYLKQKLYNGTRCVKIKSARK